MRTTPLFAILLFPIRKIQPIRYAPFNIIYIYPNRVQTIHRFAPDYHKRLRIFAKFISHIHYLIHEYKMKKYLILAASALLLAACSEKPGYEINGTVANTDLNGKYV